MKKIIILLTVLTLSYTAYASSDQSEKAHEPGSKTYYTVRLEGRNVGCALFVNDIPDLDNDYPGIVSGHLINPLLIDGKNTFTLRSLPVDEATRKQPDWMEGEKVCKVSISSIQNNDKPATPVAESKVEIAGSGEAAFTTGSFTVVLDYDTPLWTQSEKIGKDAGTQKKILAKYMEFYNFLLNKDVNGILKISASKFKEYEKSMYNSDFESQVKESLIEQLETGSELIPIDAQEKNGLSYEYYYGDRLVSIKNDENRSIIQYYDNEEGVTTSYPLYFYFDGNDFVLIL